MSKPRARSESVKPELNQDEMEWKRIEAEERKNKYKKFDFADFCNRENENLPEDKKKYQIPNSMIYKAGSSTKKRRSEINQTE